MLDDIHMSSWPAPAMLDPSNCFCTILIDDAHYSPNPVQVLGNCHEAGRCRDELDGRARSGAVPEVCTSGCRAVRAESGVMPIVQRDLAIRVDRRSARVGDCDRTSELRTTSKASKVTPGTGTAADQDTVYGYGSAQPWRVVPKQGASG